MLSMYCFFGGSTFTHQPILGKILAYVSSGVYVIYGNFCLCKLARCVVGCTVSCGIHITDVLTKNSVETRPECLGVSPDQTWRQHGATTCDGLFGEDVNQIY